MSFNTAASKLRQSLEQGKDIVVAPGVHDGFSARIAQSVGFDYLYMVRGTSSQSTAGSIANIELDWRWHNGFAPRTCRPGNRNPV